MTAFNCRTGQSRALQVAVNDSSGQALRPLPDDEPADWTYAVPGSIGETELRFVCARSKAARKAIGVKIPAAKAIADVAQQLLAPPTAPGGRVAASSGE